MEMKMKIRLGIDHCAHRQLTRKNLAVLFQVNIQTFNIQLSAVFSCSSLDNHDERTFAIPVGGISYRRT